MKCPLRIQAYETEVGKFYHEAGDCLEGACAWWRKEYPACCIYSIERALWALATELGTIRARTHYHKESGEVS